MSSAVNDRVIPPAPQTSDSRTLRRAFGDLSEGLRTRELWLHLGWQDIRQRYRRSVLGPLWITVATAITAFAMGLLYGQLFGIDVKTFLPYVTLGLVFWNFIQNSITDGSEVFTTNEGLIKQLPAPVSVHVYRIVWRQLIIFAHNIVIFAVVWVIFRPPTGWTALLIFPAMALFVLNSVWVTIVFGIISTRFRDLKQLLATAVQLVFFMTPIIWTINMDAANKMSDRMKLVELNPMYHYLDITRGPLLGQHVAFYHWAIVLGCTAIGWLAAMFVLRNYRARVAYWV